LKANEALKISRGNFSKVRNRAEMYKTRFVSGEHNQGFVGGRTRGGEMGKKRKEKRQKPLSFALCGAT